MNNRWQWRQSRASLAMARRRDGARWRTKPQYGEQRGVARGAESAPRAWCDYSGGSGEPWCAAGGQ